MIKRANILVTGAQSFIGKSLTASLAEKTDGIIATTRNNLVLNNTYVNTNKIARLPLNIEKPEDFDALPRHVDTIVHLAASGTSQDNVIDIFESNLLGVYNLAKYARTVGVKKFIFASSISIHGQVCDGIIKSDTPVINPSTYGQSKLFAETLISSFSNNFDAVFLRLPGILGYGAKNSWLSKVLANAKQNKDINIFNPEEKFNNAVSTQCLNNFIYHLYKTEWRTPPPLPLASSGMTTIKEAVETIILASGSKSTIFHSNGGEHSFIIDYAEAAQFGFRPKNISTVLADYAGYSL